MYDHFYNQVPDSTNMAGPGSALAAALGLPYDNCARYFGHVQIASVPLQSGRNGFGSGS
jgi:hypothetical protein